MTEFLENPKSRVQLRNELHRVYVSERKLRSSVSRLERHVKLQQSHLAKNERNRKKWGSQCNCFAAFVNALPEDVKEEAMRTFTHSVYLHPSLEEDKERREELRKLLGNPVYTSDFGKSNARPSK